MAILVAAIFKQKCFLGKSFILSLFSIQVAFSFHCITWAILVQILYPGTLLQTRDQGLSFGTKIDGILFIIDEDTSSLKKTQCYSRDPVYLIGEHVDKIFARATEKSRSGF